MVYDVHLLKLNDLLCFLLSDCLGRRLGPRLLGRVDDSEVSCFFSLLSYFL